MKYTKWKPVRFDTGWKMVREQVRMPIAGWVKRELDIRPVKWWEWVEVLFCNIRKKGVKR